MRNVANKTVTIIIPTYNEEINVSLITKELTLLLQEYDYKIVFVDDGSTDNTLLNIKKESKKNTRIKYISFSRNFGHQAAIKAGLNISDGDIVITMDCDMQHPPKMIPSLISKWQEGWDVVNTVRVEARKTDAKKFKQLSARWFYKLINILTDIKIIPNAADFRLLDRKVVNVLNLMNEHSLFFRGMIPWVGFKQFFLEYSPNKRLHGTTKYSLAKMLKLAIDGITSFSIKPLRIATYIGFAFSGLACLYGIYVIFMHFTNTKVISGWSSVLISILFLGGIQLIILGILGEYIGKILVDVKARPNYIVSESNL